MGRRRHTGTPLSQNTPPAFDGTERGRQLLQSLIFRQLAVFVGGVAGDLAEDADLRRGLQRLAVLERGAQDGVLRAEGVDVDLHALLRVAEAVFRLVDGAEARVALHQVLDVFLAGDGAFGLPFTLGRGALFGVEVEVFRAVALLPDAAESAETGATFIASDPPVFGRKNMKGY